MGCRLQLGQRAFISPPPPLLGPPAAGGFPPCPSAGCQAPLLLWDPRREPGEASLPTVIGARRCIQLLRVLGPHPASSEPAACSPALSPARPSPSEPRPAGSVRSAEARLRLPRCSGDF